MAHRALTLLLVLAAGFSSALVATPVLRRLHPHCTRTTHVQCSESSEATEAGLEGWVSSRRILGSAMAFIDVHAASDDVEQAAERDVAQRDPVQVLLKASGADGEGEGLRHPLDKSVYAVGTRVRITGHWRARGGKAAQSEQWLLVAHTVLVLTAAPSVHGVRSVLDAARCGTMSAAAASAALVYAAGDVTEGAAEGAAEGAVEPSEGSSGVALLVAEYAARAEPSAEQAPALPYQASIVSRV